MTSLYKSHETVLKVECVQALTKNAALDERSYFADLTYGGGGHTYEILNINKNFRVWATDQDPDALNKGRERMVTEGVQDRLTLIDSNFLHFPNIVKNELFEVQKAGGFQGILLDLGVSSHHFDEPTRGFSFRFDGPLDMRMDYRSEEFQTAEFIVNNYREEELRKIFEEYGEEKYSKKIAAKICEQRKLKEIKTTKELENIIFHCYPKENRFGKTNPSTRIFQALRLEVNRELEILGHTILELIPLLKVGGSLAIISFHSLEDRIVKNIFRDIALKSEGDLLFDIVTKKPITATVEELGRNPRSRSAKLRVLERVTSKKEKNKYKGL